MRYLAWYFVLFYFFGMNFVYTMLTGMALGYMFNKMFPGRSPLWLVLLMIVLGVLFGLYINTEVAYCSGDGPTNTPGLNNSSILGIERINPT